MSKKVIFASAIVLISAALVLALSMKEQACFWLDKDGAAVICYEKPYLINNDSNAKNRYAELVSVIKNPEGNLEDFIRFSQELESVYGEKALVRVRETFSWIEEKNLIYIVEGDQYSVLLLDKGNNATYALFLGIDDAKFYFSYDTEKKYDPIVAGWVNKLYEDGIYVTPKAFWQGFDDSSCLYRKTNVYLFTKRSFDTDEGAFICAFGRYQLVTKNNERFLKRLNFDKAKENKNVKDLTMKFIEWISS